ncbi:hypothetical protein H6504_00930 [Candidatus Woesearchaeota archaeon]|nr:hypothetical protein [Candidatus Woesearchaeota archaeon]
MLKKRISFLFTLLLLVSWIVIFIFVSPQQLIDIIGLHNGYILLFAIAVTGGFTAVSSTSYFIAVATLAEGGLHPIMLGIVGGIGLTLGDMYFYYLGRQGRRALAPRIQEKVSKFTDFLHKFPNYFIPFILYLVAGFTFVPNDILTAGLAFAKIPFRYVFLPILLGNITLTSLVAYGALYSFALLG